MSQEIVQREVVVHPATGEVIDLAKASTADIGDFLYEVRDVESRLREAKSLASREVLRRQDQAASWATPAGHYVLKGSSPQSAHVEEFDGPALREALLDLVEGGLVSIEAVDAAVETVVTYEPRKRGINALRKLGGRVAEVVNQHVTHKEKTRYVSVDRV